MVLAAWVSGSVGALLSTGAAGDALAIGCGGGFESARGDPAAAHPRRRVPAATERLRMARPSYTKIGERRAQRCRPRGGGTAWPSPMGASSKVSLRLGA